MKVKVCFVLFCFAMISFSVSAQSASINPPALELMPAQEKSFHKIKAEYALEISEIMHSSAIKDKDAAMRTAWRQRNEKMKSILLAEQYEILLKQEKTPVFLRTNAKEKDQKERISS